MLLGEVVVVFVEEALGPEAVAAAARSLLAHVGVGAPGKRLLQCPQSQCTHSFNRYKLRGQAMAICKWPLNNSDHTALEHQQLNKNNANSARGRHNWEQVASLPFISNYERFMLLEAK